MICIDLCLCKERKRPTRGRQKKRDFFFHCEIMFYCMGCWVFWMVFFYKKPHEEDHSLIKNFLAFLPLPLFLDFVHVDYCSRTENREFWTLLPFAQTLTNGNRIIPAPKKSVTKKSWCNVCVCVDPMLTIVGQIQGSFSRVPLYVAVVCVLSEERMTEDTDDVPWKLGLGRHNWC